MAVQQANDTDTNRSGSPAAPSVKKPLSYLKNKMGWNELMENHPQLRNIKSERDWEEFRAELFKYDPEEAQRIPPGMWEELFGDMKKEKPKEKKKKQNDHAASGHAQKEKKTDTTEIKPTQTTTETVIENSTAQPTEEVNSTAVRPTITNDTLVAPEITNSTQVDTTIEGTTQTPALPNEAYSTSVTPSLENPGTSAPPALPSIQNSSAPQIVASDAAKKSKAVRKDTDEPTTQAGSAATSSVPTNFQLTSTQNSNQSFSLKPVQPTSTPTTQTTSVPVAQPSQPTKKSTKLVGEIINARPMVFNPIDEVVDKAKWKDKRYDLLEAEIGRRYGETETYVNRRTSQKMSKDEYERFGHHNPDVAPEFVHEMGYTGRNQSNAAVADHEIERRVPNFKQEVFENESKKIYDNPDEDPLMQYTKKQAEREVSSLYKQAIKDSVLSGILYKAESQEVWNAADEKYMREFVKNYPEKAEAYESKNEVIKKILDEKRKTKDYVPQEPAKKPFSPTVTPVQGSAPPMISLSQHRDTTPLIPTTSTNIHFLQSIQQPTPEENNSDEPDDSENSEEIEEAPTQDESPVEERTSATPPPPIQRTAGGTSYQPPVPQTGGGRGGPGGPSIPRPRLKPTDKFKKLGTKLGKTVLKVGSRANPVGVAALVWEHKKRIAIIVTATVVCILLIIMLFFHGDVLNQTEEEVDPTSGTQPNGTNGTTSGRNEIVGLTLRLEAPTSVNNGDPIEYTVTITTDSTLIVPIESITVFNNIPVGMDFVSATGSHTCDTSTRIVQWPLSTTDNRSGFKIVLKPTQTDTTIANRVYATTTATPASGGGRAAPKCSPGLDYCSPEYLRPYFGDQAANASVVCNGESSGNPFAINTNCGTNDYSVGLFQINLVAHCPGAYGAGRWGSQSCDNLLSADKRAVCEAQWRNNPTENIKKAVEILRQQTWNGWGAARACGIR